MLGLFVKVRIKPEKREQFLKAIEEDALGSERDEPGCQRFNVLQDKEDQNLYYFYEVYTDDDAFAAHQTMPHYAVWRQAAAECLDGPTERTTFNVVFPRPEGSYWPKG